MEILHIEPTGDGWFIEFSTPEFPTNYIHLTREKIEDLRRGMVMPNNRGYMTGRIDESGVEERIDAAQMLRESPANQKLNLLFHYLDDPADMVSELFADAYGEIIGNRGARQRLGLKAVTRDGDADLKAVQDGAEVRPWNASKPARPPIAEFIRGRKEARNASLRES